MLIHFRPTAQVLDHFDHEINEVLGGVEDTNGKKQHVRVALLAGADLVRLQSFAVSEEHYS